MRTLSLISLLMVMVAAACGFPAARSCSVDSDCSSDAVCSNGICQGVLIVTMRAPSTTDPVHTNGQVDFEIAVSGGIPDKLELVDGSTVIAELKATLTYSLDTRSLDEGSHTVFAQATIGQNSYTSAPATIVVDRTRPTVLTLGPAPGDTDVDLDEPIQVTFSEPISAASLSEGAVLLVSSADGQALSRTLTLSADGKTLAISPIASLPAPCTLTATLTSLITDLAGNSLVPPEAPWTWSLPLKCAEDSACPNDAICVSGGCRDVFADRNRIVFVSTSGSGTADGTHTHPLATIQAGVEKAATLGAGARVYVEAGTYHESVSLRSEVSIFGGYGDGWRRDTKQYVTTIAGGTRAVSGSQVFNVALDGLSIISADATGDGESSYGVILSQSQNITASDCDVVAGNGATGSPGASGTPGSNGYKGGAGANGTYIPGFPDTLNTGPGGPGGAGVFNGGAGGTGNNWSAGQSGKVGLGPSPGAGGSGGTGSSAPHGASGLLGTRGANGKPGSGGVAFGSVGASGYSSSFGTNGTNGSVGSGGGGGGAGAGYQAIICMVSLNSAGGGGGGGGSGGGGTAGFVGQGGGGSFGVFLMESKGIAIHDTRVTTGQGGAGGAGGNGGNGGIGGAGGIGGYGGYDGTCRFGNGGAGGAGGSGGNGGAGGGGGGGPSIAIVEDATSSSTRTNVTPTLGNPGAGGTSPGNAGATGEGAVYKKL